MNKDRAVVNAMMAIETHIESTRDFTVDMPQAEILQRVRAILDATKHDMRALIDDIYAEIPSEVSK
jgi:hypothetical protein